MEWKDSHLVKAVIKSTLGGNLRLRTYSEIKLSNGSALKTASGTNTNPFYHVEETPSPIVSDKISIAAPVLKETKLYDLSTEPGKTYTLIAKQKL
jgi:alpha-L-fucosidase 2